MHAGSHSKELCSVTTSDTFGPFRPLGLKGYAVQRHFWHFFQFVKQNMPKMSLVVTLQFVYAVFNEHHERTSFRLLPGTNHNFMPVSEKDGSDDNFMSSDQAEICKPFLDQVLRKSIKVPYNT